MTDVVATEQVKADRLVGGAMLTAAALSVFVMAHHPTHVDGTGLVGPVHGAMISLMSVAGFGFAYFAVRRGLARPLILAGLVAYAIGLFAGIGAGTINGFVVPALMGHGPALASRDVFVLAWEANQALATLGIFATAAAYVLWSVDFLGRTGREAKIVGALGLAAGLVPAALLASGATDMHVAGAIFAYAALAAWAVVVGIHLVRGGLDEGGAA